MMTFENRTLTACVLAASVVVALGLITHEGPAASQRLPPVPTSASLQDESVADEGNQKPDRVTKAELQSRLKSLRQQRIECLKTAVEIAEQRIGALEDRSSSDLVRVLSLYENLIEAEAAGEEDVKTKIDRLQKSLAVIRRYRCDLGARQESADAICSAQSTELHVEILLTLLQLSAVTTDDKDSAASDTTSERPDTTAAPKEMDAETRTLCEERRRLLREAIKQHAATKRQGVFSGIRELTLYRSWAESELALAATQEEKERIAQDYVDQVQHIVGETEARIRVGVADPEGLTQAQIQLVEAKQLRKIILEAAAAK